MGKKLVSGGYQGLGSLLALELVQLQSGSSHEQYIPEQASPNTTKTKEPRCRRVAFL